MEQLIFLYLNINLESYFDDLNVDVLILIVFCRIYIQLY